ncbi:unnamed protein product [Lactuca virosa]|uniref:Uncharacterized protein n=1 Tax=Lactuca virosa TaxID=75947 RepID=A0AAU9NB29_9ASTR|nr:unnamed protein product [Lactuca virosa]
MEFDRLGFPCVCFPWLPRSKEIGPKSLGLCRTSKAKQIKKDNEGRGKAAYRLKPTCDRCLVWCSTSDNNKAIEGGLDEFYGVLESVNSNKLVKP